MEIIRNEAAQKKATKSKIKKENSAPISGESARRLISLVLKKDPQLIRKQKKMSLVVWRKRIFKLFFSYSNIDKNTRDCIKDLLTQEKGRLVKYVVDKCVARLKIKKTVDGSVSNPIYQLISQELSYKMNNAKYKK